MFSLSYPPLINPVNCSHPTMLLPQNLWRFYSNVKPVVHQYTQTPPVQAIFFKTALRKLQKKPTNFCFHALQGITN